MLVISVPHTCNIHFLKAMASRSSFLQVLITGLCPDKALTGAAGAELESLLEMLSKRGC